MNSVHFITLKTNRTMIHYGIHMAGKGTESALGGGGGEISPYQNEGGAGKIVPLHFWTVRSLFNSKLQKNQFKHKNHTGVDFMTYHTTL